MPAPATIRKAEREVEEFRKFQRLSREFVRTNTDLCRSRMAEPEPQLLSGLLQLPAPSAAQRRLPCRCGH